MDQPEPSDDHPETPTVRRRLKYWQAGMECQGEYAGEFATYIVFENESDFTDFMNDVLEMSWGMLIGKGESVVVTPAETTPLSAENAPWSITAVDSQVVTAARELSEGQKAQPDWLWFNHDSGVVAFGRWGGETAAPYVRADLALTAIAAARANVPPQAGDDRGLRVGCGAVDCVNRCDGDFEYAECPNVQRAEKFKDQVTDTCARAEKAEAELAALSTAPPARPTQDVDERDIIMSINRTMADWWEANPGTNWGGAGRPGADLADLIAKAVVDRIRTLPSAASDG